MTEAEIDAVAKALGASVYAGDNPDYCTEPGPKLDDSKVDDDGFTTGATIGGTWAN
jgi:hypothetical protein